MSRRRAGRASIDEVLAQADQSAVEAAVDVPSASRARRRQVNFDDQDAGDAAGIGDAAGNGGAAATVPEAGAAVRRSRFQPSTEESGGSEDVVQDEQSDINPQALAQVLRSKVDADRSQTNVIEICIPAARVNAAEDPPLQLLRITQNDFPAQVGSFARRRICFESTFVLRSFFAGPSQWSLLRHARRPAHAQHRSRSKPHPSAPLALKKERTPLNPCA